MSHAFGAVDEAGTPSEQGAAPLAPFTSAEAGEIVDACNLLRWGAAVHAVAHGFGVLLNFEPIREAAKQGLSAVGLGGFVGFLVSVFFFVLVTVSPIAMFAGAWDLARRGLIPSDARSERRRRRVRLWSIASMFYLIYVAQSAVILYAAPSTLEHQLLPTAIASGAYDAVGYVSLLLLALSAGPLAVRLMHRASASAPVGAIGAAQRLAMVAAVLGLAYVAALIVRAASYERWLRLHGEEGLEAVGVLRQAAIAAMAWGVFLAASRVRAALLTRS